MYRSSLARQTLFGMLGSARASRAGDGALAIANFSLLRALRRGAAM